MKPPIIILGMHRSGTSFLTSSLKRLGVFIGHRLDEEHDEAYFFFWRNEYLLLRAGASWEDPEPLRTFLDMPRIREDAADFFRRDVRGPQFIEFLGVSNWLSRKALAGPWGWKDPRTVFTLPVWRLIFPDAKLLLIHRNGIDVARSLHKRALNAREWIELTPSRRRRWLAVRLAAALRSVPTLGSTFPGRRCTDLDFSYQLWEQYVQEAINQFDDWPSETKMAFRFEDFVASPESTLREIADFCEAPASPEQIGEICSHLNRGRSFAFTSSPELIDLYQRVSTRPLMMQLGYNAIPTVASQPAEKGSPHETEYKQ